MVDVWKMVILKVALNIEKSVISNHWAVSIHIKLNNFGNPL